MRDANAPTDTAPGIVNALTVDVEDYFQVYAFHSVIQRSDWDDYVWRVEANTDRILEIFANAGVRGTFFTLGMIAERFPALIRRIVNAGHELASHGWAHFHVFEQDRAAFLADISRTKSVLEDVSGTAIAGYRAASFSINARTWWAFDALQEAGYRYSSSINPIRHDHYGLPGGPRFPFRPHGTELVEIPVSTVERWGRRLPSGGGGYFRLLPYGWFASNLKHLHKEDQAPGMFYMHPWEIDPDQPRIAGASLKARFRHYVNLDKMAGKLERLLRSFRWDRVDRVFATDPTALPEYRP